MSYMQALYHDCTGQHVLWVLESLVMCTVARGSLPMVNKKSPLKSLRRRPLKSTKSSSSKKLSSCLSLGTPTLSDCLEQSPSKSQYVYSTCYTHTRTCSIYTWSRVIVLTVCGKFVLDAAFWSILENAGFGVLAQR